MTKLKLANDLTLPVDVVTQTVAILAKRRAGKSYTMRRLAEQLFSSGQQIVIVDPKGDQWGIRSASDGKSPGLSIVILGGERGDVPLEPSSGEVVAKLVVEERVSVLLDLSTFRKSEVATFMTAFLENLYRLKAREIYRTPVMLVIDEADAIAPQKPQHGEERMLGAAEDIVRRGGQRGIGCVLVSQRSAVLNKNVLTQAQVLVALRTIAPQDLAAMKAWIDVHGTQEQCKTLMDSLPSLPVGDAWFWSPGWPTIDGIFKRVSVLPIQTFDSGATPKPGVTPVEPKKVADVDLDALKRQMSATIEKAKADDPKELRRQIVQLQRDLNLAKQVTPAKSETIVKEVPVLKDGQLNRIEAVAGHAQKVSDQLSGLVSELRAALAKVANNISTKRPHIPTRHDTSIPIHHIQGESREAFERDRRGQSNDNGSLGRAERAILTAIAQTEPAACTRSQASIISGYSIKSSSFSNALSSLRSYGFISGQGDALHTTERGLETLGPFDYPPKGRELAMWWGNKLGQCERMMLETIVQAGEVPISKESLSAATGYSITSSSFSNALSKLRSLKLIEGSGELRASHLLID